MALHPTPGLGLLALVLVLALASAAASVAFARRAVAALRVLGAFVAASPPGVAADGDVVRVQGSVAATTADASAPVSGTSCAGYVAVLERRSRLPGPATWRTVAVAGALPQFTVRGDHAGTVDVALSDDVGDAGPPGRYASALQLAVDARSEVFGADDPLPEAYDGLDAPDDRVVRVREHRLHEDDHVLVAGRATDPGNGRIAVERDDLVVLADDPEVGFLSLVLPVVTDGLAALLALGVAYGAVRIA